jgi:cystathionine beta-synthase
MSRILESPEVLDRPIQELMEPPLPVVDSHVDLLAVRRLLNRQNPAVLVRRDGEIAGIITRYDVLQYVTG